jgi:hypothetical protein
MIDRRSLFISVASIITSLSLIALPGHAYTPDPNPLRESLYLISRVQEATVQQERLVRKATQQDVLQKKMKLSLRLVEKSYKLVDQITYCSSFVQPVEGLVDATAAGMEAAEELQSAVDFVNQDLTGGAQPLTNAQREFLIHALTATRERLFDFVAYMPQDTLEQARKRIEEENVKNIQEFDGDEDAGVYNPVRLPWKNRQPTGES